MSKHQYRLLKWLTALFCAISFVWAFSSTIGKHNPIVQKRGGIIQTIDGAYYLATADAFWTGRAANLYSLETQKRIFQSLTNSTGEATMPLNTLPTALVVLWPFVSLAGGDLRIAYSLWMGTSIIFLVVGVSQSILAAKLLNFKADYPWVVFALIPLLSYSAATAVVLGQTSVIHCGCLLIIVANANREAKAWPALLVDALCIFVLSAKPQFGAIGFGLCLVLGRARGALIGAGVSVLAMVLMTPRLGLEWAGQYLDTLRMYQGAAIDSAYRQAFAPELMNIFAPAFSPLIGQQLASRLTWLLLGGLFVSALAHSFCAKDRRRVSVFCGTLLISAYTLFAPHSGFYEEILWAPIVALALSDALRRKTKTTQLALTGILVFAIVNRLSFDCGADAPGLWWTLKAIACLSFVAISRADGQREAS